MPSQIPREVRVNLRLAKSISDRIERVAEVAGQSQSVMAALALAAGLKALENTLLPPPSHELAAALAVKLAQRLDADEVDQMLAAAEAAPHSQGSG